jgi:hypothetical protein
VLLSLHVNKNNFIEKYKEQLERFYDVPFRSVLAANEIFMLHRLYCVRVG